MPKPTRKGSTSLAIIGIQALQGQQLQFPCFSRAETKLILGKVLLGCVASICIVVDFNHETVRLLGEVLAKRSCCRQCMAFDAYAASMLRGKKALQKEATHQLFQVPD